MLELSRPAAALRTRLLGFDKEDVRACVQNLVKDFEAAQSEIQRLKIELESARASTAPPALQETAGVQIDRVLTSAYRIAEEVKAEAERTAKTMLREAQEEAAHLRAQAEADAAALTRTAAARLAELEVEIQEMIDRRVVVQAMLDRAADRLNQIANDMRQAAPSADPATGTVVTATAITAIL